MHLDDRAKEEWKTLVPILKRMKVLSEADGIMLGNLCQAYSLLVKSQAKLQESGPLFKAPSGYPMANPLIAIINGCQETITKISREFGLTPASRTRIQVAAKENAADDVLDF